MQGAGNDFVLIETSGNNHDWPKMAQIMCDRRYGIGADSIILLLPSTRADVRMRVFDADGSEAEACGNGIRCLGRYAWEKGITGRDADQISVETAAGIRTLYLNKNNGKLETIRANMGKPLFLPDEIPVTLKDAPGKAVDINGMLSYRVIVAGHELTLNLVSMGNPHAVFFQKHPVAHFSLSVLGPEVENLPVFPNRINFEVVRVISKKRVEARVWERGVGETMACGSGACAIFAASQKYGYTDKDIEVSLPGGTLEVEWNGGGEVLLSGPAENVFSGEWPD